MYVKMIIWFWFYMIIRKCVLGFFLFECGVWIRGVKVEVGIYYL